MRTPIAAALALVLAFGCTDQTTSPTALSDDVAAPTFTVDRQEFSSPYDMDWDPPYTDCATGEDMQNHGILLIHIRETTTPSGNVTVHGWVDYDAFGPITLEGLSSGDIWTLNNGHNPFGEVIKDNGFYLLHYQWSELYSNPEGRKLHIHLKGHVKVNPDGTVTINRESYTCR